MEHKKKHQWKSNHRRKKNNNTHIHIAHSIGTNPCVIANQSHLPIHLNQLLKEELRNAEHQ